MGLHILMESIEQKIINILEELLMEPLDYNEVNEISFEKLGLDSFMFMRLLVEIENEFGFSFETDSLEEGVFENLNKLVIKVKSIIGK